MSKSIESIDAQIERLKQQRKEVVRAERERR